MQRLFTYLKGRISKIKINSFYFMEINTIEEIKSNLECYNERKQNIKSILLESSKFIMILIIIIIAFIITIIL